MPFLLLIILWSIYVLYNILRRYIKPYQEEIGCLSYYITEKTSYKIEQEYTEKFNSFFDQFKACMPNDKIRFSMLNRSGNFDYDFSKYIFMWDSPHAATYYLGQFIERVFTFGLSSIWEDKRERYILDDKVFKIEILYKNMIYIHKFLLADILLNEDYAKRLSDMIKRRFIEYEGIQV
jgi:hypothetical protein